jgi:hypothetical protein
MSPGGGNARLTPESYQGSSQDFTLLGLLNPTGNQQAGQGLFKSNPTPPWGTQAQRQTVQPSDQPAPAAVEPRSILTELFGVQAAPPRKAPTKPIRR